MVSGWSPPVNAGVGRAQHRFRTVGAMTWLPSLLRGLGTAGATANARAEVETAHVRTLQAAVVAQRVNRSGGHGLPLSPSAEARVA
jgi:hypothetical protein